MRYRMKKRYVNRLRIVLLCMLICAAVLTTALILRHRLRREDVFPIGADAVVDVMDRRVMALENGTLYGFNAHGRELFCASVGGAQSLCIGDDAAAAYGTRDVYLFERSGRIRAHIKTDTDIRHVLCGASLVTVITQDGDGQLYVCTYDTYANLIDEIDSSQLLQGDRLLDAGIRGNRLWLLTADTDGAQMLCHAYVFNVQDNTFLCRMDVYDQLIYDVFQDENNVFLIGTDSILCYNYNGMLLWQMPSADMTYIHGCEYRKNAALLFSYDNTQGGRLVYRTQVYALTAVPDVCSMHRRGLYVLLDDVLARIDFDDDTYAMHNVCERTFDDLRIVSGRRMLILRGGQWIGCMIP